MTITGLLRIKITVKRNHYERCKVGRHIQDSISYVMLYRDEQDYKCIICITCVLYRGGDCAVDAMQLFTQKIGLWLFLFCMVLRNLRHLTITDHVNFVDVSTHNQATPKSSKKCHRTIGIMCANDPSAFMHKYCHGKTHRSDFYKHIQPKPYIRHMGT